MNKQTKQKILNNLSTNLSSLIPELHGFFKCPTCLADIPLAEEHRISVAHIIPQAAGGKLTTFLCKDCNSTFGAHQDKWLGEALQISKKGPFSNKTKGFFWVNGLRVNGWWGFDERKGFTIFIDTRWNSPAVNRQVEQMRGIKKMEVSFPVPFLKHKRTAEVGFLTAAYLICFAVFRYSWVLQEHLNPIRQQILEPTKNILDSKFSAYIVADVQMKPWVGIGQFEDQIALIAGFERTLVLFPPFDSPAMYSKLKDDFSQYNLQLNHFRPFYIDSMPNSALGLLYDRRMLILPDRVREGRCSPTVIRFSPESPEPDFLYPVTPAEFRMRSKDPNATFIKVAAFPDD